MDTKKPECDSTKTVFCKGPSGEEVGECAARQGEHNPPLTAKAKSYGLRTIFFALYDRSKLACSLEDMQKKEI